MDKKAFIKMDAVYGGGNKKKVTEVTKVYVEGPTKMLGNEYVSLDRAEDMDVPVFDELSKKWVYRNISELLIENKTTKDITVLGVSQGEYSEGIIIPKGTSFEDIIHRMLSMTIPAVYINPTLNINGSENKTLEAGTIINPVITPAFIQNDAGNVTRYILQKNNVIIKDGSDLQICTDNNLLVADGTIDFRATVFFDDGPIKNNNLGEASPDGKINTGSILSNIVRYTGVRNLFYGYASNDNMNSSNEEIRSLDKKASPAAGTTFTINIPAGAKKVIFAYPSTIRDVSSIKYVEGLNAEVKSIFGKLLLDVSGTNNYNPIEYKVFIYTPSIAFSNNATYTITI